jgi:pyochelin synthetase
VSHLDVLKEVEERGLSITAVDGDLRLQGPRERIDPDLVNRIRQAKPQLLAHLEAPPTHGDGIGLTPLQRAYLLGRGSTVEMGNVASHVYHEIEGVWDVERLETALQSVVDRCPMLRTSFTADGRQHLHRPQVAVRIVREDLRGLPPDEVDEWLRRARQQRSHRVLPAERAPLLAVEVSLISGERMILHVSHDGLVIDGISMLLFFRRWWEAYQNGSGDGESEPPEELSFTTYLEALEKSRSGPAAERSRRYWLDRLDDLTQHPDLPLATSPAAISRPRFSQRLVKLDAARWTALKAHGTRAGVTPTCLVLAAYAETLGYWGGNDRFTVTTTVANRPPIHPRIMQAIGNFSDTMLVEVATDQHRPFRERVRTLQERLRQDIDHRHFSGANVLRELARRGDRSGLRVPYTFNSTIGFSEVDGSALELFGPEIYSVSQTPQVWLNVFVMEQRGGLVVQLDGVDELYPDGLLDALVEGLQRMLESLQEEAAWSQTTFDLLPAAQRTRRQAVNATGRAVPDLLLPMGFVEHAEHAPQALAVLTTQGVLSYGALHRHANRAARWLRERGIGRDDLVGLVMNRGPEQIIGILATVMAGAAYLPIDATLPTERKRYFLRDGQVRCVLTNRPGDAALAGGPYHVRALDATAQPGSVVALPTLAGANPDDLAYVLYTSGSTGAPKGAMVTHRSVVNVVSDCNSRFGIAPQDRFFAISAFHFDLSVYDVFGALTAGAALVMPDPERAADPAHWLERCAQAGVTVWNSVPAIVDLLREQAAAAGDTGSAGLATLRLVMMSGDRIPPKLPSRLRALRPDLQLMSLGGPTETTIWNILHPIGPHEDGSRSISYGRPNANNRAYILDRHGRDTPDWVSGEICAAGVGLARGYWADPARTGERFFDDPRRGERLYRTGDLGRYLPDGDIDILGRSDFQIKVNGYRVEAGEVETHLIAIEVIKQAVVVRQTGERGDRLVAHLVAAGDERPSEVAVRGRLREQLPEFMVPAVLVWHEALPLTANGKVDRGALVAAPPPAPAAGMPQDTAASATEVERGLAQVWASVLRRAGVGMNEDFYDLGGDSLAGARILTEVRKRFQVAIPLDDFYGLRTVRLMAARVAEGRIVDGET